MQDKELNRATTGVVSRIDISGRTADEIKPGLQTEEKECFWRIASSTFLGSLMMAGFLAALAPLPARAGGGGVPGEIAALQAQVAALQDQVNTLQTQLAAVQSNNALKLGPFVSIVSGTVNGVNGPHIFFTGANIHIVSGSTITAPDSTGLGNLIIGYNEVPFGLSPGDRGGAHNLVIGRFNRFTKAASGGFVAGESNTINFFGASVSGGSDNTASGLFASVSGGFLNTASGDYASVNCGQSNTASGFLSVVSGGFLNTASGLFASVSGGFLNTAGGNETVVIGGQNITDNKDFSIAPNPPFP